MDDILIEPIVRAALAEDLGRSGDITSRVVVPADAEMRAVIAARKPGVISGVAAARLVFAIVDPSVRFEAIAHEGDAVQAGSAVARVSGNARSILSAERVALNMLCHLSGVATSTAQMVSAVQPYKARIADTRKTTPGLRALEKQAVRAGGGVNHRFGLDDAILIKDNHVAVAGSAGEALRRAKAAAGHLVRIEIEVDTLAQLDEVLAEGVDAVLLDNMPPEMLAEAVRRVAGRAVTEASGGINAATINAVAASGVDLISVGWLTHSAPILDLGLDIEL